MVTDLHADFSPDHSESMISIDWIVNIDQAPATAEGLILIDGYNRTGRPVGEVAVIEKAAAYGAHAVFFEGNAQGGAGAAQAFVFVSDGPEIDLEFAEIHQRLWSWGGVPLVYRKAAGVVQLFRCAHAPDFARNGKLICNPYDTLRIAGEIASDKAWWDAGRLRSGTLWDVPHIAEALLSGDEAAHRKLIVAVRALHTRLETERVLNENLRRRLLILALLIAYLDQRGALPGNYFDKFLSGSTSLSQVFADGKALISMLEDLKGLFNGDVFEVSAADKAQIKEAKDLDHFSRLIEAKEEVSGQMNLWALYSFRDLPVEVISHIYELFVSEPRTSVYTPPALVRLILEEVLDDTRIERILDRGEVILDPTCGSGVFLVEAFKKLVLYWRSKNGWIEPDVGTLRTLFNHVHGVDKEAGAIELATFSLCLAMCDALTPETIRKTPKLFPALTKKSLTTSCFFAANKSNKLPKKVGLIVGNPPFASKLTTRGAKDAHQRYLKDHGPLPDLQIAYLFLNDSMALLADDGILAMLQQSNFLYNECPDFRHSFFSRWDVREILDFVSVRGQFTKDTKVVVVVAAARRPAEDNVTLHAVFRRGARAEAKQRYDIDMYDMHRLPQSTIMADKTTDLWRANLLGGARVYDWVKRMRNLPTLREHAKTSSWTFGEGFVEGGKGVSRGADHLYGKQLLPSNALTLKGVDRSKLVAVEEKPIEGPRSAALFTPPMMLIRKHAHLPGILWQEGYLTYKNEIVGLAAQNESELEPVRRWLEDERTVLKAYIAATSLRMFNRKATAIAAKDVFNLPFNPKGDHLRLSRNERLIANDIVAYYMDFIRLGSGSELALASACSHLANLEDTGDDEYVEQALAIEEFSEVFIGQVNAFYPRNPLRGLGYADLGGVLCQAFAFGAGEIDWSDVGKLKGRLNNLLQEDSGSSLTVTRIARIYDEQFIFLLKPDRLRYWLPSTALIDSDEVLADLRALDF